MTFWWFKEKRIPKKLQITAPSYYKISTLRGITSDALLGNFKQILKANIGITTWPKNVASVPTFL
jgi:hypothetical protein